MNRPPAQREHLSFVDALRGVAALMVAVFHLHQSTAALYPDRGVNRLLSGLFDYFDLGKFAVVVFFMVSGYLIPTALDRAASLGIFVQRRFLRLYPAYWVSIACAALAFHWGLSDEFVSPAAVAANLTMAQGYLGQPDCIGAFWTLQIELTFYVICAVLFWFGAFGRGRWVLTPLAMLGALAAGAVRWAWGKPLPVALLLALALMFAADALRRRDRHARWCLAIVAAGLLPTCALAYGPLAGRYLLTYYAAMVVFLAAYRLQAWPGFGARPLRFFADTSYSVYLLHGPFGITLALAMAHHGWNQSLAIAAGVSLTVAAAWLVYRMVEEPCIRLGRKFESRPAAPAPLVAMALEPAPLAVAALEQQAEEVEADRSMTDPTAANPVLSRN